MLLLYLAFIQISLCLSLTEPGIQSGERHGFPAKVKQ